jgi:hypothetical protein
MNHEIGICLPHFVVNVTSTCLLTIRSKYASTAHISLLSAGRDADGSPVIPLATHRASKVAEAVNHHIGYYYLEPKRCPQTYAMRIKGAKLLASGAVWRHGRSRGVAGACIVLQHGAGRIGRHATATGLGPSSCCSSPVHFQLQQKPGMLAAGAASLPPCTRAHPQPPDIATLLRRTLGVSSTVLPAVAFESNGMTIAWLTSGTRANLLSYTVRGGARLPGEQGDRLQAGGPRRGRSGRGGALRGMWRERPVHGCPRPASLDAMPSNRRPRGSLTKQRLVTPLAPRCAPAPALAAAPPQATYKLGGPTMPDFSPFRGTPNKYCSLLDINPAPDLDANPADGVADASTVSLVGRVPRAIPGRPGYYICAVAPAGGYVRVRRGPGLGAPGPVSYAYAADSPNVYLACGAGGYLYKLGAVNAANDRSTDFCMQCPRGSYATSGAALCGACPPATYQDRPGQRTCKRCQFGYAPVAGAARCMDCYYGRPYCSEGYTPNEGLYTCNSNRLPEGYSPEAGFSVVHAAEDPPDDAAAAAAKFAPLFRNCRVRGGPGGALLALNVSAECRVELYALGDLGRGPAGCSQNPRVNSITAFYSAPNLLSGLASKGLGPWRVGIAGKLNAAGLAARVFATAVGARVPEEIARPTPLQLVVGGGGRWGGGRSGVAPQEEGGQWFSAED